MTSTATAEQPAETSWAAWRSPTGRPAAALPLLYAVAALAGLSYAWGIIHQRPQLYYLAAARSMSTGPHDFFFAAFDPAGLSSIDKLPGAFWIQAASIRIFGPHIWAAVLPQVIEGVLTVLLLYRVVRRVSGPAAGVVAALVAACLPATVALDRGNMPDTLLILLLVAATERTLTAVESGRRRAFWVAGVLIGLAFETKMVQAWVLVPVLALAYTTFGPGSRWRRTVDAGVFGVLALVVSLAWMTVVSMFPADRRPYVDGSHNDSLFDQVFRYNAAARADSGFSVGAANFEIGSTGRSYRGELVLGPDDRAAHLFTAAGGRTAGWLVPLALVALIGLIVLVRRRDRNPPVAAALTIWGGWLVLHVAIFSAVGTVNPYYLAVLTPAVAAIIAMASVEFSSAATVYRALGVSVVVATVLYGWWLSQPAPAAVRWTTAGAAVVICLVATRLRPLAATGALLVAALVAPAVASADVVVKGYGALDTPFEPSGAEYLTQQFVGGALASGPKLVTLSRKAFPQARYPAVADSAIVASPFIFTTGAEVPAFGGFTGAAPILSVDELTGLVRRGQIGFVLIAGGSGDARVRWIEANCHPLPRDPSDSIRVYQCARQAH